MVLTSLPSIRPAKPGDYDAFARLCGELGTDDPIMEKGRFVDELMANTLVAEAEGGAVVGYAYFQLMNDVTYVRHIVAAPDARRRGVGRALMEAIARRARAHGSTKWCLNVKPHNDAAIALYTKMGLSPAFNSRAVRIAWSAVDASLAKGQHRMSARKIDPEDDARVETAFGLLDGQLADARKVRSRVVLALESEASVIVGATVFHPHFPGAYPFRVASSDLALPFLQAIRGYANPADTFINVMIEGRLDVADALVDAGAVVRLDVVHMKGPLPL